MGEKPDTQGETQEQPAQKDDLNAHCNACGGDFHTDKDFAAKDTGSKPRCKCQSYKVVPLAKWKEQHAEEEAEKNRKAAEGVYGDTGAEVKILRTVLDAYGIPKDKATHILMNWEGMPEVHDPREFYRMLADYLQIRPAQAEFVTRVFFNKLRGSSPGMASAPGSGPSFSAAGPGVSLGFQSHGAYSAPASSIPSLTTGDVARLVAEGIAKEREADRAKAMEERLRKQDEEIAKLKAGEGVKPAAQAPPPPGKVRIIKQPIIDPETRAPLTDPKTGTILYTFIEEPIEQETSEERFLRIAQEKGLIGQSREAETPKWVGELTTAVKALKPADNPRPMADLEARVEKERNAREDAEKQARADREKLQRDLDTARSEKADVERARAVDSQLRPIQERLAATEREAAELRARPPGTDPHLARMQGEQGLLKTGSDITIAAVDRTVALIATSPIGQAMAAQQRMEISMKAAQFAKQNDMDPGKFAHDILAGPLATAPTPTERENLTDKMKKAAEGAGGKA